jgi:ras family
VISTEEGQNKAAELKAMFVELSAKEGTNVNALFKTVVSLLPKSMVDEETQKCMYRLRMRRRHSY